MRIDEAELRDPARALLADLASADADVVWTAAVEQGWPALTAPDALGGLEQPPAAAGWLYRELGRALSPAPLLPALAAAAALAASPPSPLRDEWIGKVAGGETVALSLLAGNSAVADEGTLSGRLLAVQNARRATHLLVAVPTLVALVPLNAAGVAVTRRPLWDNSRDLADVAFDCTAVDEALVLARGAEADAVADALSAHLHLGIAADSVGAAEVLLEQTVAYLVGRRQYNRPLAMFQALKHRCADLATAVAASDALLSANLLAIESGAEALPLARMTKSHCATTFRMVAEEAVQLHGGMGMTSEHPCHLFLKRALLNEQLASAADACDLAVVDALAPDLFSAEA